MVAVAEQCAPPHVERHAVRRQVTGAMNNWCGSQQDADLQPVRGWNKPWHRMVDSCHVEQPGDIDSRWRDRTRAAGCHASALYAQETVADREARIEAALTKLIVALGLQYPGEVIGWLQYLFHGPSPIMPSAGKAAHHSLTVPSS